ncbi:argininosuccinate synthase domain-containing protein [Dactylosporangium sp. NPDC051484]|uniref:argininosuccinate synthase domain-containing protein n=1 Tax=Dactylosporangium sp. NPDC051484 TaxID=3154942 RepID=UPI003450196F
MYVGSLAERSVGVLQGGGLSSTALGIWLAERGVDAHHLIADIGQAPRAELEAVVAAWRAQGAPATLVDLRAPMAALALDLVRYQARHDGGYWNTTGAARLVLVEQLAPRLVAEGHSVLAHGCVGGGNDQRRFARYTARFAPGLDVYAPWIDPSALRRFPGREAMLDAVQAAGLPLDEGSGADWSTDASLAGASHESAALEDLRVPVDARTLRPRWSRWPADAPDDPRTVTVTVAEGRITDIDGSGPDPIAILLRAGELGAHHGVWLRDVVERRIIGTVCRGVYEAPALEVLGAAWQRVLQTSLDQPSRALYEQLSGTLGAAVYEAWYADPAAVSARAALDALLERASATVTLTLHRGTARPTAVDVTASGALQQTRFGTGGNRWREPLTAAV